MLFFSLFSADELPLLPLVCRLNSKSSSKCLGVCLPSKSQVGIKQLAAAACLMNGAWACIRHYHSADLLHILSLWSHSAQTDAAISFSPARPPATSACQRPEACLTAQHRAPQPARISDCCNMLRISLETHSEYNYHRFLISLSQGCVPGAHVKMKWVMCNLSHRLAAHEVLEISGVALICSLDFCADRRWFQGTFQANFHLCCRKISMFLFFW